MEEVKGGDSCYTLAQQEGNDVFILHTWPDDSLYNCYRTGMVNPVDVTHITQCNTSH